MLTIDFYIANDLQYYSGLFEAADMIRRYARKAGTVQTCNASYGFTGWLGVAQVWKPVRALAIAPPTGRIVEIGRPGRRREQGRSALALGSGAAPSSDAAAADRKAADPIRRMRIICSRPPAPAEPPPCPWHSCSSRLPAPATWPAGFPPDHVLRTGRWRC